ncbi:Hypothetical_protein [Hexamita inflata]|nr:Hypothetical protein HINF_LOCUS38682 [Hexamita inflata]
MQYVKNQSIIEMCNAKSNDYDQVVIYLDSTNRKLNKLQTYNLKVLYIIILKEMKIQHKIPVDNGMMYTLKNVLLQLQNDDFVKCVISRNPQDFKLVTGEIKQYYPSSQFKVSLKEIQILNLFEIQSEYTKVNVEFDIIDMM